MCSGHVALWTSGSVGLTRKPFVTPYGEAVTDTNLVDELERKLGPAAVVEDYCHAIEHSIEFQVVFLQRFLFSAVLPPLLPCCAIPLDPPVFTRVGCRRTMKVAADFRSAGEMGARGRELLWVLGVQWRTWGSVMEDRMTAIWGAMRWRRWSGAIGCGIGANGSGDARQVLGFGSRSRTIRNGAGRRSIYTFLKAVSEARGSRWNSAVEFRWSGVQASRHRDFTPLRRSINHG